MIIPARLKRIVKYPVYASLIQKINVLIVNWKVAIEKQKKTEDSHNGCSLILEILSYLNAMCSNDITHLSRNPRSF